MDDLRSVLLLSSSNSSSSGSCGGSAIVYVSTKAEAEDLAKNLTQKLGITAAAYHGGMTEAARKETYNRWSRDEARVVCATVVSREGKREDGKKGDINIGSFVSLSPPSLFPSLCLPNIGFWNGRRQARCAYGGVLWVD